jgi:hypothetical protein
MVAAYRRVYQIFDRIRPTLVGRELTASEIIDLKALMDPERQKS